MAVKWLNKILGKQNQQKPRTTDTVAFHDLKGWISDRTRAELGGFFESAAQIFAEIKGEKEELIRCIVPVISSKPFIFAPSRSSKSLSFANDIFIFLRSVNTAPTSFGNRYLARWWLFADFSIVASRAVSTDLQNSMIAG
jgi:hypothetical protein